MKKFKGKILIGVMCLAAAVSISMLTKVNIQASSVTPTPTPTAEEYYFDYGGTKISHGGKITIDNGLSINLRLNTDATTVTWASSQTNVADLEPGAFSYERKVVPKGPGYSEISATFTKDGVTKTII